MIALPSDTRDLVKAGSDRSILAISLDKECLRELVREVIAEAVGSWPAGRIALTESEAAAACGVARHVLRDLRLAGRITARRLGRRIVYSPADIRAAIHSAQECSRFR
jgi:predicted transcriptional regulator